MEVYLTMVQTVPGTWKRVGPVYRKKSVAKSWLPFVKSAWLNSPARVKTVRIQTIDGKATDAAKRMMSDLYNVDVD